MNFPENLKYTKDHEWISVEGNIGTIGITDFAQGELGDVVFFDVNPDPRDVNAGDSLGTIEAVKTVSDLFSPVSGKLIEVNPELADHPEYANTEPYGKGWMVKVELSNPSEIDSLLSADQYKALVSA